MDLREIDVLVAEKVMGGKRHQVNSVVAMDVSAKTFTIGQRFEYPRYTEDISAAWEVVEKIDGQWNVECRPGLGTSVKLIVEDRAMYSTEEAYFDRYVNPPTVDADSAPLAICLAALKAVGVEI